MIKQRYEALQTRIDALSLRERAIIFVAISALLYLGWDKLLMGPVDTEQQAILNQIETVRTQVSALDKETQAVMERQRLDPNEKEREQLAKLDQQLQQANQRINKMISGLIEPRQMAQILEKVLQKQEGLKFIRLENLGRVALVDVGNENRNDKAPGIFRHTMRLELEGSYTQALAYLRALETLPWQFRWDEVRITTLDYPKANIVIKVHTLSLQEGWIGV
jgi:MSHA biogenesis protein MshJ